MPISYKSAVVGFVACLVALIAVPYLWNRWNSESQPLELLPSPPLAVGEGPLIEYPSEQISQSAREQFLEGNFSVIKDLRDLPVPVLRAFTEQGGSRLVMANPGENFRATDVVTDRALPYRRLIFAGVSGDRCFVHYELGGIAHSYLLALFNVPPKGTLKPVWVGYCGGRATKLEDLRSMVANGECSQMNCCG
jgi:hypothetical protein